jgi:anti-sigma factor ChrR (cupin superfamily)
LATFDRKQEQAHQRLDISEERPEGEYFMSTESSPKSIIVQVCDREWKATQPGIRMKNLWADRATNRRAFLTRFDPGASLPLHRHAGNELLYVIEGTLSDDFGTVAAGDMSFRPDGCVHSVTSRNGATSLVFLTGGIEPTKEIGDGPNSRIFRLNELGWTEFRPGLRQKRIWEDEPSGRRAMLVRFEPGALIPKHRHVGEELVFVIEGATADESGAVTAGNFSCRPNGCVHSVSSKNGATALLVASGRTEPV